MNGIYTTSIKTRKWNSFFFSSAASFVGLFIFSRQPKSPISGSQTLYKRKIACFGVGQKKVYRNFVAYIVHKSTKYIKSNCKEYWIFWRYHKLIEVCISLVNCLWWWCLYMEYYWNINSINIELILNKLLIFLVYIGILSLFMLFFVCGYWWKIVFILCKYLCRNSGD